MDKLPDYDFGGRIAAPPVAAATSAAAASAEPGVKPRVIKQGDDAEGVGQGSSPPFPPGKLTSSSRAGSAFGRSRRELSRVADETISGTERGGGANRVAGAEDDNDGSRATYDPGSSLGGGDGEPTRPAFAWVPAHEGDAGPHTAVPATNAGWAMVARDMRLRLSSAWLSCDQVQILTTHITPAFASFLDPSSA